MVASNIGALHLNSPSLNKEQTLAPPTELHEQSQEIVYTVGKG